LFAIYPRGGQPSQTHETRIVISLALPATAISARRRPASQTAIPGNSSQSPLQRPVYRVNDQHHLLALAAVDEHAEVDEGGALVGDLDRLVIERGKAHRG